MPTSNETPRDNPKDTQGDDYADRLRTLSGARWKQVLDVQRPYRWNLKRLELGRTLDVGCGIGRNLGNLSKDSVGVDHNASSVRTAQLAGYTAMTVDDFMGNRDEFAPRGFDSMLLAHVLEHVTTPDGLGIISDYLPYVREKVVVICPQEKGFTTDETHINFLDAADIEAMLRQSGLSVLRSYSFPFPRPVGKVFAYNETVVVARKPTED